VRTERVEEQVQMLSSWKEIASYLGRTIRTCQRLETTMGMPIHRLDGSPKAHVFAYRNELDSWLAQKANEHEEGGRKARHLLLYGLAGVAAIAAAIILIKVIGGRKPAPDITSPPGTRSIAVLVRDLTQDTTWKNLPDGIAEAVRNALMQIQGFNVPGWVSSDAVRDRQLSHDEIGRLLNVEDLLLLNVQVAGKDLRVTAQLINVKDGFQRWAHMYDRQINDIFEIQEQISRSIANSLKITLSAGEDAALRRRPTADMKAYELYLTGRLLLGRPWPETPGQALHLFEQALGQDPKFALAYVGKAWVYMNMIAQDLAPANQVGPQAEAAAKAALALDPDLPDAIALNAYVQYLYGFNWDAGEKGLARALELKPGDAMIRGWHALSLFTLKRFEEARVEIRRALSEDPLMPILSTYFMWIHLYTGRNEEVLEEFRRVQPIQPGFEFAYFGAGEAYLKLGRIEEGLKMLERARGLPHSNGRPDAALAVVAAKRGDREAAEAIYKRLKREHDTSGLVLPIHLAWIRAELGDIEGAYGWLEVAIREHDPGIPFVHIYVESLLPEIARQSRFQEILDRLRLPH